MLTAVKKYPKLLLIANYYHLCLLNVNSFGYLHLKLIANT